MTASTISREELREMLEALHDTAAARGETDIVVQCRGFLEELNQRGCRSTYLRNSSPSCAKGTRIFVGSGGNEATYAIARSARAQRHGNGWPSARRSCCRFRTITWYSRCLVDHS